MRFWWLWCVLLLVPPASAQELPEFQLPEVVVPGKRPQASSATPASVTVVTREDLERIGARTVADALRLVPEVMVRVYGGPGSLAEPSVRGFGPGQVLVLLDGVPLNNVALGQADLSTISTAGVERIEVLRGAFGAISGSGAVAGVINIVTSAGAAAAVQFQAGGYGERRVRVGVGGGGFGITVEASGSDGARTNSDAVATTAGLHVDLAGGVRVGVHHTQMDVGTPGDVSAPTPFDRQSLSRTVVQTQWGGPGSGVRGRAYYTGERLLFSSPFGPSTYASSVLGGEIQREWSPAPGRAVVAGLEARRQTLDALVFGSPIAQTASVGAGYVQYDAVLSPRALASLAVRVDAHSTYGVAVNPRAGVVVVVGEHTRVRAGVGHTFRGPTFLHLFFPGCSNPALRPESAWTAEASVERSGPSSIGVVTAFATEATDLISGGCPPQNVGAASVRGLSGELRGRFGPGLTGLVNVTLQQAVDRLTGAALPRVPGVMARFALTKEWSAVSRITVLAEYVGPRIDTDFSVFPSLPVLLPAYVELALRYQHDSPSGWTFMVGIDNVLDASYEVVKGYPVPGRTLFITAGRKF